MTQTHSVSLGCPGCPKKSQHSFSPPNARADQRSARTRLASGDTSRALNNPSVVRTAGALQTAHMPHALSRHPHPTPVYIRTRSVHVSYTLFFTPVSTPTHSFLAACTQKHAISKNRIVHVSHFRAAPFTLKAEPILILPQSCPSRSSCPKFPAASSSHLRPISKFATPSLRINLHNLHSTQINSCAPQSRLIPKIDNTHPVLHSSPMAKPALGRGLGALMGGSVGKAPISTPSTSAPATAAPAPAPAKPTGEQVQRIPVTRIVPCPFQPRKDFTEDSIKELADSIKEQGILQPLIVRARNGSYELIAGERRWRAAQIAGLTELPVLVREADDRKVLELALIENLQRENLNPIEEALGYSKLIKDFNLTQEEAAVKVGKNRATVANLLRILQLHPDIQNYVRTGLLSFGHGRALLGITNLDSQKQSAEEIIRDGLSVRETEQLVTQRNQQTGATKNNGGLATKPPFTPDVHIGALQTRLQERFG